MSPLRASYLALAVWGAVQPYWHFFAFWSDEGVSAGRLLDAWLANQATIGLASDLLIAGIALCIWIVAETRVRQNWSALVAIPATLFIGIGCGLPLYLFLRTRPVT